MRTRIVSGLLIALILIGVGVIIGVLIPHIKSKEEPPRIYDTATLVRQIKAMSQLVTVKYLLERVVVLEDVKWYGENRVIIVAHGVVKAGIDLTSIKPSDINIKGTNLYINLPAPQITDVYLDDSKTEVVERTTGLLRKFDKTLEQEARRQAVDELRRAAKYSGILQDAEQQAKSQIKLLLSNLGFAVYFYPLDR